MIPLPKTPKVIKKEETKAVFEIEGLYPGYGVTLGNSLRRTLLSSLEGAAITKVKIKGVSHEFSTISGVLEDTVIILLNLKKIRFKLHGPEPQVGSLKVKGEKEVKASDFKLPPQVEVMSGDFHIATITDKKTALEMEITIERGVGYEPLEIRKKEKLEIGAIALDAIYTPVKNVSFKVENMRVGERTDYDRLVVELETDGTISPEEAFTEACDILVFHFSHFKKLPGKGKEEKKEDEKKAESKKEKDKKETKKEKKEDVSKIKVEELKVSTRTKNALLAGGIKTIGGLARKSEKEIGELKGLGEKGLGEVKKALKKLDTELKED